MDQPEQLDEKSLAERALDMIPGGTSTGSKRHAALFGDDAPFDIPSHYLSASGCELTLADGNSIVDCTMALGAVSIGYADELVNHSVIAAINNGNVGGLAPALEMEVAERLAEVIPCAERVRFLKTGAEGTAAAVRLARVATGRNHVIGSGYFGWLDWSSEASGVPDGVRRDFSSVPFDDIAALESRARAAGKDLAAIILEPVVEKLADENWVKRARALCDEMGAVLIFDEIKTGFRLRTGGYQEMAEIKPDLAIFGKALANGFPLSAVVGRANIMEAAERSWISSTLACETAGLAAAAAMIEWHERAEVCESLWSIGEEIRRAVAGAVEASGIDGVQVDGIDPMWLLRFDNKERENRFVRMAMSQGALFKRGAYNFSALSHDEKAVEAIEYACSSAFVALLEEESTALDGDEE